MAGTEMNNNIVFQISGKTLAWCILPLPSVAFALCVILSIMFDFKRSTATHCGVPNYLPSISSAIGGFTPQRYIWRICIALHCAPRLMLAVCYYNHYMSYPPIYKSRILPKVTALNSLLHICEILCLVGLSYVSSTENFAIHEMSFIGFVVFSQLYMLLTVFLFKTSRSHTSMRPKDEKSYTRKKRLAFFNIAAFLLAVYVYFRHNWYCEPGMFTAFAFLEYNVVISNIIFHGQIFLSEFGDVYTLFALLEYSVVASNIAFHATFTRDFPDVMLAMLPASVLIAIPSQYRESDEYPLIHVT